MSILTSIIIFIIKLSESGFLDEKGNLFGGEGSYTVFAPTDRAFNEYLLSFEGEGTNTLFNQGNGVRLGIDRLKKNKDELIKVYVSNKKYLTCIKKVRTIKRFIDFYIVHDIFLLVVEKPHSGRYCCKCRLR